MFACFNSCHCFLLALIVVIAFCGLFWELFYAIIFPKNQEGGNIAWILATLVALVALVDKIICSIVFAISFAKQ